MPPKQISITQINNGWILSLSGDPTKNIPPSATFFEELWEVINALKAQIDSK
jgi:hypothetical protein